MKVRTTVILLGIFIILLVFVYFFEGPLSKRDQRKDKEAITLFPDFKKDNATKIEVKSSTQEVSLEKKEEGWLISNTDGFTADPKLVTTALDTVKNFTRENMASKNPEKQELFEVTRGKGLEVKVSGADENILAHFHIGKIGPDFFSTYLRKEGSEEVLLTDGYVKSTFDKSVENWRDKTIFDFPAETISQLTLKTPEDEIVLKKDEKGDWQITKPEKCKAKKEMVVNIGTTLASLKATGFAEDYNLEKYQLDIPQIKITAILGDKEEKQLLIAKKQEEKSQYYVKNQAKKTIFLVGKYQIDKMNKSLDDLKKEVKEEKEEKDKNAEGVKTEPHKKEIKDKKEDSNS